jgi:4-hydroxy-tetrahydrodipicolinate synthase
MKSLSGTGVALVTPFDHHLEIDFEGLRNILSHTAAHGADYYVVMGTTAEVPTLTSEEKQAVLSFVKENNERNLPIVYGLGGNNTQALIDELTHLDLDGVSALLSVSPYYNKPSQNGFITHFTLLANHSPVPVLLYNIPGRTAVNLEVHSTLSLADHPNIIGIKESSGDLEQIIHLAAQKPDDFMLISGDDLWAASCYALGADGVISVLANGLPEVFHTMYKAASASDISKLAKCAFKIRGMHDLMYEESNPVGIKQLLFELGLCEPHVRLPLVSASEGLAGKIRNVLESWKG